MAEVTCTHDDARATRRPAPWRVGPARPCFFRRQQNLQCVSQTNGQRCNRVGCRINVQRESEALYYLDTFIYLLLNASKQNTILMRAFSSSYYFILIYCAKTSNHYKTFTAGLGIQPTIIPQPAVIRRPSLLDIIINQVIVSLPRM